LTTDSQIKKRVLKFCESVAVISLILLGLFREVIYFFSPDGSENPLALDGYFFYGCKERLAEAPLQT
jgi:hypothetical protein